MASRQTGVRSLSMTAARTPSRNSPSEQAREVKRYSRASAFGDAGVAAGGADELERAGHGEGALAAEGLEDAVAPVGGLEAGGEGGEVGGVEGVVDRVGEGGEGGGGGGRGEGGDGGGVAGGGEGGGEVGPAGFGDEAVGEAGVDGVGRGTCGGR